MFAIRRILVPVDFSGCSRSALEYATFLARRFGAEIDVLHAWEPPTPLVGPFFPADVELARLALFERSDRGRDMKAFLSFVEGRGDVRVRGRLEAGDPSDAILRAARESAYDLIVMGTHGRTGMSHLLLGSISEVVVRRASCPVLTVHAVDPTVRLEPSMNDTNRPGAQSLRH
jgi:nucleotide-binding universal stress UspA family protein